MIRGLMWAVLFMLSQSVFGETLAQNAKEWIDTRYPRASLQQPNKVIDLVKAHAALNNLSPNLVLAVIATESSFKKNARSPSGAIGLMQVVPYWHKKKIRGRDLTKPDVAIEVGVIILRDCMAKSRGYAGALRCYCGYRGKKAQVYTQTVLQNLNDLISYEHHTPHVRMLVAQQSAVYATTNYD